MTENSNSHNNPTQPVAPVIFGTAGHIDHGKSSLIKALTGTDPDRLEEEKRRGITIELGFAFLNDRIAFIDVPGHEKFVKNMVAGAATIDYAMLVIAADDGVMPQTREHLDILNLLGVDGGLVIVTKADLVEDDWLELVREEAAGLVKGTSLEDSEILVADSLSGRGLDEIRSAILKIAAKKRIGGCMGFCRMPVDRVFTMKGFGTVATGSLISGSIGKGDQLEILPRGEKVRVKNVQSQGREIERAVAGQRTAINLAGVSTDGIRRGDILATPAALTPSGRLDARLSMLSASPAPLKHRQRVHLHLGAADLLARVVLLDGEEIAAGSDGFVQFRLESETAAQRLDRFVIRRYSPQVTIGGGVILDADPAPHRRGRRRVIEALERLCDSDDSRLVVTALESRPFATLGELAVQISKSEDETAEMLEDALLSGHVLAFPSQDGNLLCPMSLYEAFLIPAREVLNAYHEANPLRAGMRRGDLVGKAKGRIRRKLPKQAMPLFISMAVSQGHFSRPGGDLLSLPDFEVSLTKNKKRQLSEIERLLGSAGLKPPSEAELSSELGISTEELKALLGYLVDTERVLALEASFFFPMEAVEAARKKLAGLFEDRETLTVSEIRDAFESTRRFALPLLNYFDIRGWTRREGELRRAGPELKIEGDIE